ncbi:MAG TPA: LLM class flavin-dependent oxidoreductase [Acidimicrobiales bacterium]
MKVRIGVGTGGGIGPEALDSLAGDLVELGFDSLWMPEVLSSAGFDPLVALAWVSARRPRLKVGTTMLLPGRNVARTAKQLATLDVLSGGRFLVTFVPGLARGPERSAVGLPPNRRGAAMDEMLPLLRRLWAGETVTYDGPVAQLDEVSIEPRPLQEPFDVWLGGSAQAALERCGRLGDGWLPAMSTAAEVAAGRRVIETVAAESGRSISEEHFGVSVGYATEPLSDAQAVALGTRARGRPLEALVPTSLDALRSKLRQFVDVGFSKFVVRPLVAPADWRAELEALAAAVGDLQT